MTRRAILSVYDKTGLEPFAQELAAQGWDLVASGGTAQRLRDVGLTVLDVSELTGVPEMLGGRVKTLHPTVHSGILARHTDEDLAELAAQNVALIDMVVCNLYPFRQTIARPGVTLDEAVEQIDVGGVTLLRAAAKNFTRVTVLCDPGDYESALRELHADGQVSEPTRRALAVKAFAYTRDYDTEISRYLARLEETTRAERQLPDTIHLRLTRVQTMRYGENPHQTAALYALNPEVGPLGADLRQGKPLSFNNLLDLDAAWRAVAAFEQPAVVIVKHLSPCGVATHPRTAAQAFPAALASDPVSAFGGVIAVNRAVDEMFTKALEEAGLFVEAVLAPDFSPAAEEWFATNKKKCRLMALRSLDLPEDAELVHFDLRSVREGYLIQDQDRGDPPGTEWQVVTEREPTTEEWEALRFAWQVVPHVKSNAIVLANSDATVGIGGGLPSRVDAVRFAVSKAGDRSQGAVMASDAFFPFADGVEVAAEAGVTAVIQPGGSIRDKKVVEAANRLGLAMVFTGTRHFRH